MQIEMSSHASTLHLSVYLTATDRLCALDRQRPRASSKFFGRDQLVDDAAMRRRPTDLARGGEQHTNRAPAA